MKPISNWTSELKAPEVKRACASELPTSYLEAAASQLPAGPTLAICEMHRWTVNPQEGIFDAHEDSPALALIQALKAAIDKARQEVENTASALQARGQALRGELEASAWFARIGSAKTAYEQLKADLQQQGVSDPSEYGRLAGR